MRTDDELLTKQLRGHVPTFDGAATDHTVVNGRTLREQLKYGKQLVAEGHADAPVLGKRYHEELRQAYIAFAEAQGP